MNLPTPKIEMLALTALRPYRGNARRHSKRQVRQIADSIERFGFTNPILISDDGEIIAGHGRVVAAKELGLEAVPTVKLSHLSAEERRAYVLARRIFSDGRSFGGVPLSRGAVYQILRNRLYRGEIAHRGEVHKGNHIPIVDEGLWAMVQERLTQQSRRRRGTRGPTSKGSVTAPLAGLLFDECGNRMTPTYAVKHGRSYRYYASAPLTRGGKAKDGIRVPAPDLEQLVFQAIADHLSDPIWLAGFLGGGADSHRMKHLIDHAAAVAAAVSQIGQNDKAAWDLSEAGRSVIERIVVEKVQVTITLHRMALGKALSLPGEGESTSDNLDPEAQIEISVPAQALRCGKQVRMIVGDVTTEQRSTNPNLVRLVTDAYRWFEDLRTGRVATIAEIASRDGQQVSHVSRTLSLAFLAPDIVGMILDGGQPAVLTPERLGRRSSLPLLWSEQRALLLG